MNTTKGRQQGDLGELLRDMIQRDGPLSVERYMALCLGHPELGYYMSGDPFGRAGDFITAPEVSQMFGELIGIWCAAGWQMMDAPAEWNLIELGPGRGTLMSDLIRAASVMPGWREGMHVHLVEMSPGLRKVQEETLKHHDVTIDWHDRLEDVPARSSLIIANEFFDALPVVQIQNEKDTWHERQVGLDQEGQFCIGLSPTPIPDAQVPDWARAGGDGDIAELAPQRLRIAEEISRRLTEHNGAALIVDYGHAKSATGDTLQAVYKHKYVDVLSRPGQADLTAHVDFEALQSLFEESDLKTYGPVTQAEFLLKMGLREREDMLRKRADARQRIRLSKAAQRLVAGNEMGQLFKVLVATHPDMPKPAPFNVEQPT